MIEGDGDVERERKGLREGGEQNRKGQARHGEREKAYMTENINKEMRIDEGLGEGEKKRREREKERTERLVSEGS